jgi:hypothetical protein
VSKAKELIKELTNDNKEMRTVLDENKGFKTLENTVNSLVNLLVSKTNEQLNPNQRQ